MIIRYLMLLFVLLGLSSCESTAGPSFEKMSETELVTYNASVPVDEKVVCQEAYADWIGGSYRRIPKVCITIGAIVDWQRQRERGAWGGGAGYGSFSEGYQPADAADYPSTFNN